MTPESSFEIDETEFEKELKGLGKKEFMEFRKKFREFTSYITHKSASDEISEEDNQTQEDSNKKSVPFKEELRMLSRKLHLLKKEFEKREFNERVQERIEEMLRTPDELLQIDIPDFREAIHYMEGRELKQYIEVFKKIFSSVITNRRQIAQQNANTSAFDKQQRDNMKIIKRWDLIEEEMTDRERRMANVG